MVYHTTPKGCQLKVDIYGLPANPSSEHKKKKKKAVVAWFHEGALICGSRKGVLKQLNKMILAQDKHIICSFDYRLAPETKLAGIKDDVQQALAWLASAGLEATNGAYDASQIFAMGASAGGYLALLSGHALQPAPKAVVSLWGYGDLLASWYTTPSEHYRQFPAVSQAEAQAAVGEAEISESSVKQTVLRRKFYLFCRQQGLWPSLVCGHDPASEPHWFRALSPLHHISPQFPPTLLVHGLNDTDVPHSESLLLAQRLAAADVPHYLLSVPGADHFLAGAKSVDIEAAYQRVVHFLLQHTDFSVATY